MNEESIRVRDMIDALKSRWMFIVSIALILTIASASISFFVIKPKYEASTKLFIGKEENSEKAYDNNDVQMYQKLLKTYSDVIMTKDLIGRSIEDLGIEQDVDVNEIMNSLTVTPKTDTQILVISYKDTDKEFAKDLVAAVTDEFIKTSTELISNANVKVVESVTLPEEPVSPNKKLNVALALIIGLAIGCGLSILFALMDNTFKDKEHIELILDVPVIGAIPNTDLTKK